MWRPLIKVLGLLDVASIDQGVLELLDVAPIDQGDGATGCGVH
jgi:hypothetical protein